MRRSGKRDKEKEPRPNSALVVRETEHKALRGPDVEFRKEFKVAIINMLKELRETMFKELKEGTMTPSLQVEDSKEKIEIIQNSQMKTLN